jgi:hypothetical protein
MPLERVGAASGPKGVVAGSKIDPSQCRRGGWGQFYVAAIRQSPAGISRWSGQAGGEGLMSVAEQAYLLTGELFVLSFLAIAALWFADRLRRNFTGKP